MCNNQANTSLAVNKQTSDTTECNMLDEKDILNPIDQSIFNSLPTVFTVTEKQTAKSISLTLISFKESSKGSFGIVFEGILNNNSQIAIKRVLQDSKYKNRELLIMKKLNHNNITSLLYYFYTSSNKGTELNLNLVMDFIPQTFSRILKFYFRSKSYLPIDYVKIYIFQMFRGLNYIHQSGICHRDIKPQNILLDPSKTLLRICDFGSAKTLISTESNVSYICSRYYRAPELIFGATNYTFVIDIWSAGCVFAEVLSNKPLFPGETSVDQIVEIIKILGSPSKENVTDMNPDYTSYKLPVIAPCSLTEIFTNPNIPEDAFHLLKRTFEYSPKNRITALRALVHPFFDSLREQNFSLSSNRVLPSLTDFSDMELGNSDETIRNTLRHIKVVNEQ